MFRHVANEQSQIVWYNLLSSEESRKGRGKPELYEMSYHAVPRAIFSWPQIATVGMTLSEALASGRSLLVGRADYADTAKGIAMGRPAGFVRIIVDSEARSILGATVIGPEAPTLIQEIVNLMYTPDRSYLPALQAIHIHPALPEVVQRAFGSLAPVGVNHHHHDHNSEGHQE
jgi:dihydrolipoamide dehydrogenase